MENCQGTYLEDELELFLEPVKLKKLNATRFILEDFQVLSLFKLYS
jgi:hypothetical protein